MNVCPAPHVFPNTQFLHDQLSVSRYLVIVHGVLLFYSFPELIFLPLSFRIFVVSVFFPF